MIEADVIEATASARDRADNNGYGVRAGSARGRRLWSVTVHILLVVSCAVPPAEKAPASPEGAPGSAVASLRAPVGERPAEGESIEWQAWGAAAFAQANRQDRLVLIHVSAPWAGRDLFAHTEAALRALIEQRYVPVRVDPLRRPDIARRYTPAGWPAVAVALPDGRLVAAATDIPSPNIRQYLLSLANHYRDRRAVLVDRVTASRPPHTAAARPRQDASLTAAALFADILEEYDDSHGGFGAGPKFPEVNVLHFLLDYHARHRDERALSMALRGLDILTTVPMWEEERGGVLSYSFTPDWTSPIMEKDAADQAGLLQALVSAREESGGRYRDSAAAMVVYIRAELFDSERGVFHGRQVRFPHSGEGSGWWTDPTVYTDRNALLIQACLRASTVVGPGSGAADMALAAATYMLERCVQPDGIVYHCITADGPRAPGLLDDQVLASQALSAAYRASGREAFAAASRRVLQWTETHLRHSQEAAFADALADPAAAAWQPLVTLRDSAVPAGNAIAAELYLEMGQADKASGLLHGRAFERAAPRRAYASCGRALMRWQALTEVRRG